MNVKEKEETMSWVTQRLKNVFSSYFHPIKNIKEIGAVLGEKRKTEAQDSRKKDHDLGPH